MTKFLLQRHNGDRPWKCEYCDKDFLHKESWKCHMRRHRGERPFTCELCSSSFTEQWALKKHMRLHTGEKPYECPICSKSFSDLSNFQKHKKTHKNATGAAQSSQNIDALADMGEAHLIYLTIDPSQSDLMANGNTQLIIDDDLTVLDKEPQLDDDKMLSESTIVEDSALDQIRQTFEFNTEDGGSFCVSIPSNVDPIEFVQHLSNLS